MAMKAFFNEIRTLKVKEVPARIKPMLSGTSAKNAFERWLDNYHAKYIETSSVQPLLHVCYGGMALSYILALPEERRHLEHKEHAEKH